MEYTVLEPLPGQGKTQSVTDATYFSTLYSAALSVAVALALVMIVIGGIEWSTSFANPSAKEEAKKRITGALVGLVLALVSWLILNTINPALVSPNEDMFSSLPSAGGGKGGGGMGGGTPCKGPTCYTEEQARALLKQFDIGTKDICPPGQSTGCVRLEGVRQAILMEAVWIKGMCECEVFITGGTEDGHSSGHLNGYKIDIRPNDKLNDWVETNMRKAGKQGGFDVYVNDKVPGGNGAGWMHENPGGPNDHWDIDIRGPQNGVG